jgi:hypothetical protein
MKPPKLWPLALFLWICLGTTIWAQVTVSTSGGVGAAGSGNGVTGYFADGTVAAPSVAWASDADGAGTGFYRASADNISMAINGSQAWLFNNSFHLTPGGATSTRDLGSTGLQIRDFFIARSIQGSSTKTLTESAATGFVTVSVANSTVVAGRVVYSIRASDATDTQGKTGELFFSCVATSAGVVTCGTISDVNTQNPVSTGTLTNTMTNTTAANLITLLANAASSLTQTTLRIDYRVELMGNTAAVTGL